MPMNRRTLTGGALAILAVLFVTVTLLSNYLFRGARIDLTENRQFTLSEGTRKLIASLDQPVHLSLYFSDKATSDSNRADLRSLRVYFERVRELLEELSSDSAGKIKLDIIDPLPFSEAEDRAAAAGLQGLPLGPSGEKVFLGLVGTKASDGQAVVPFFDPGKESLAEYDVAKLIHSLQTAKKPAVGLIDGLEVKGGLDGKAKRFNDPWIVYQQLSQLFEVRNLKTVELKSIPGDINLLILIHPKNLNDDALYAIDQFVLRGGRLLAFVDPNAEQEQTDPFADNPQAIAKSSGLPKLFSAWGIDYKEDQVLLDRTHAATISLTADGPPLRHPAVFTFGRKDLRQDDVIVTNLDRINLASTGYFTLRKDSPLKAVTLFESSNDAMPIPAERIRLLRDPAALLPDYKPTGERYLIGARLEGNLASAFPDRQDPGHLAQSKDGSRILLIADTDLLADRLWVQVQDFFGQKALNPFASNGELFLNAVDHLSGSSDLISIRGRASSQRPFLKVNDIKLAADNRFRVKEQELQTELADTEHKLLDLQSGKGGDQAQVLSPEQKLALDKFLKRKLEIRKELREVRRRLDADIEALGTRLKLINIALVPVLLTVGALAFALYRSRRRGA